MSEVGEDKVGSHVHTYIVESTMCMNMAFTMLKDMSNVAKRQNKMIQEKNSIIQDKDGVITKMKSKLKIFNKIKKKPRRNLRVTRTSLLIVHIVTRRRAS